MVNGTVFGLMACGAASPARPTSRIAMVVNECIVVLVLVFYGRVLPDGYRWVVRMLFYTKKIGSLGSTEMSGLEC